MKTEGTYNLTTCTSYKFYLHPPIYWNRNTPQKKRKKYILILRYLFIYMTQDTNENETKWTNNDEDDDDDDDNDCMDGNIIFFGSLVPIIMPSTAPSGMYIYMSFDVWQLWRKFFSGILCMFLRGPLTSKRELK